MPGKSIDMFTLSYRDGNGKCHSQKYSDINDILISATISAFRSGAEYVNIEAGHGFGDDDASM